MTTKDDIKPSKLAPLSTEEKADHERSAYDYPWLDIEEDEYVVIDVLRSKIGRFFIWFGSIGVFALFLIFAILMIFTGKTPGNEMMALVCIFCAIISLIIGIVLNWIYGRNVLILSNQRVFERVQITPFSYRVQSLELEHVEDVSYDQNGILPMMFNYGSIRMSTVGDEHTYKLTFVNDPTEQIKIVKKVIHAVDEQDPTKYHIKN